MDDDDTVVRYLLLRLSLLVAASVSGWMIFSPV